MAKYRILKFQWKYFSSYAKILAVPMAETPRHGNIISDKENVLPTVFVQINENSLKNYLQLLESIG